MTRTIAIYSSKGGCGKTTTTVEMATELTQRGYSVLVVDFDPAGYLTYRVAPELRTTDLGVTLSAVLCNPAERSNLIKLIQPISGFGWDLIPSQGDMSMLDQQLAAVRMPANQLALALKELRKTREYDLIFIDPRPGAHILTDNILVASTDVIIPVMPQSHYVLDITTSLDHINSIRDVGLDVRFLGTVLTNVGRSKEATETVAILKADGDLNVLGVIPERVAAGRAAWHHTACVLDDGISPIGLAYKDVVDNLVQTMERIVND